MRKVICALSVLSSVVLSALYAELGYTYITEGYGLRPDICVAVILLIIAVNALVIYALFHKRTKPVTDLRKKTHAVVLHDRLAHP